MKTCVSDQPIYKSISLSIKRLNDLVLNKKIIERYKKNFLNTDINIVGNNLIVIELKI